MHVLICVSCFHCTCVHHLPPWNNATLNLMDTRNCIRQYLCSQSEILSTKKKKKKKKTTAHQTKKKKAKLQRKKYLNSE